MSTLRNILLITVAFVAFGGGDKPRFRFEGPAPIQPVPMDERLLPAPVDQGDNQGRDAVKEEQSAEPQEADRALADTRPVILLYECRVCQTYKWLKGRIDAGQGELSLFRWQVIPEADRPAWVKFVPAAHYQTEGGEWRVYPRQSIPEEDVPIWSDVEFIAAWKRDNPNAQLQAVGSSGAVGATLPEQLAKFFPDGTVVVIQPPRPVKATLDNGAVVSFRELRGKFSTSSGIPVLALDQPLPSATFGWGPIRLGFDVRGATYEAIPVPAIALDTSRGKFRLELKEVK